MPLRHIQLIVSPTALKTNGEPSPKQIHVGRPSVDEKAGGVGAVPDLVEGPRQLTSAVAAPIPCPIRSLGNHPASEVPLPGLIVRAEDVGAEDLAAFRGRIPVRVEDVARGESDIAGDPPVLVCPLT
jgi:hypothetical protein